MEVHRSLTALPPEVETGKLVVPKGELLGNALLCKTDDCNDLVPFPMIESHYATKHNFIDPSASPIIKEPPTAPKAIPLPPPIVSNVPSEQGSQEVATTVPTSFQPPVPVAPQPERKKITFALPKGKGCSYCDDRQRFQGLIEAYYESCKKKGLLPTLEELELYIFDVAPETVTTWITKKLQGGKLEHPELIATVKKIISLQKLRLMQKSISRHNSQGAVFLLKSLHNFIEQVPEIVSEASDDISN